MTDRIGTQYNRGCKNPGCSRGPTDGMVFDFPDFPLLREREWAHLECYIDLCVQDALKRYLEKNES
mgnify:CR=1 FL=1